MKLALVIFSLFACLSCHAQQVDIPIESTNPREEYIWLEDLKDQPVINWIKAQDSLFRQHISNISSRAQLDSIAKTIIMGPDKAEYIDIVPTANGNFFIKKRSSSLEISKLYWRARGTNEDILLFEPESIDSGTYISYFNPSWDDSKVVIGITDDGKEFSDLRVYDVARRQLLPGSASNSFPYALGGIEWLPDNSGFLYTYIPDVEPSSEAYLKHSQVVLHKIVNDDSLNTDPIVIFSRDLFPEVDKEATEFPVAYIHSPDNTTFSMAIVSVNRFRDTYIGPIHSLQVGNSKVPLSPIFNKNDSIKEHFMDKQWLYFMKIEGDTNHLCRTSLSSKAPDGHYEILFSCQAPNAFEEYVVLKDHIVIVQKSSGVKSELLSISKSGEQRKLMLPVNAGAVEVYSKGTNSNDFWIYASGWTFEETRFHYEYNNDAFILDQFNNDADTAFISRTIVEEVQVPAHDDQLIPLSIVRNKSSRLNGGNRVLLHAYGAYGISQDPRLDYYIKTWIELGGIYACAHVRGGGEKGTQWYLDGKKKNKPNTWLDIISSAEYLVDKKYTSPNLLSLKGGSAGGIGVGRAILERPDLFAAAYIYHGILNPLREGQLGPYEGFNSEFGNYQDKQERTYLKAMDAFENIEMSVRYPAVICKIGMNDARVPPWQSIKFVSKISNASSENRAYLMAYFDRGHDVMMSGTEHLEDIKEVFSFLLWQTGHPDFQSKE